MKGLDRTIFREGHLQPEAAPGIVLSANGPGQLPLGLDKKRDGWLYVPKEYTSGAPVPLVVLLHGAGGTAEQGLGLLQAYADKYRLLLLAPASRKGTWDIIAEDQFGPDLFFINEALSQVFRSYSIDPKRLAIGGFSDGASYALCIGLSNGGLFTHIMAFSPGFAYAPAPQGRPDVYISHGIHDNVLPINHCSRKLVPRLKNQGYNITYEEFNDEHIIPSTIRKQAIKWFLPIEHQLPALE